MSTLNIRNINGDNFPISIPSRRFPNFKISQLQEMLERKSHVTKDQQRLLFGGQILISDRLLGDYGITANSTIQFASWEQEDTPEYIKFIRLMSSDTFRPKRVSTFASVWDKYCEGINFQGTCSTCYETVIVQKGFYKRTGGHCVLKYEMNNLPCPICKTALYKNKIEGVGIYKSKLTVRASTVGQDEISYSIESRNKFLFSESLSDINGNNYEYIVLTVSPL